MSRRLRKFILITGTTLCVLIAAAFVVSARWQFAYKYPRPNGPAVILLAGAVWLHDSDVASIPVSGDTHNHGLAEWKRWEFYRGEASRWWPDGIPFTI